MSELTQNKNSETMNTLLCQQKQNTLILPDVVIAEIIDPHIPLEIAGTDWYLKKFSWRDQQIPIISLDRLLAPDTDIFSPSYKLVVMNALTDTPLFSYYGIITFGTPGMARIDASMLIPAELESDHYIQAMAKVNDELVGIPDLMKIESEIAQRLKETELSLVE